LNDMQYSILNIYHKYRIGGGAFEFLKEGGNDFNIIIRNNCSIENSPYYFESHPC